MLSVSPLSSAEVDALSDSELCSEIERACAFTARLYSAGGDTSASEAREDVLFAEHERRAQVSR